MTDEEMHSLYVNPKVKAYITATHGEGFGLPIFEAAYSGLPVLAPAWSGHVDFLKHAILLPGNLQKVHRSAQWKDIIIDGSQWFYVNHGYASRVIKDIYKHYKKYVENARTQGKFSRENFSLDKMREKFAELLDKYLFSQPKQVELKLPKLEKIGNSIKLPELNKVK